MDGSTVLVVERDEATRVALAGLLARLGRAVECARDAPDALARVAAHHPELAVLDLRSGGLELCRELVELEIRVIMLSAEHTQPCDAVAALLAGADDYVAKPFDPDELLARARRSLGWPLPKPAPTGHDIHLSQREAEVLQLLSDGRTQRQIAAALYISEKTVGTHVQHILAKLGVHSRAQAIAAAHAMGLVPTWHVVLN